MSKTHFERVSLSQEGNRARGYKTFFMLNSVEHKFKMLISIEISRRVLGSIPGLATYFRFSFRFFKKDSCQLLAKVCAGSTG